MMIVIIISVINLCTLHQIFTASNANLNEGANISHFPALL